jgi:hypothetical protein
MARPKGQSTTLIRISIENKELLEEKKRKFHLNSIDRLISILLEKEEEFSIIKKIEKREKAKAMSKNMQFDDKLNTMEKPKMKLPLWNGKCVFKHEREDGQIDCAKDLLEKGNLHVLTDGQCNECWNNAEHKTIELLRA